MSGSDGRFAVVDSVEALKASGAYLVVTPDECVALARPFQTFALRPLMGGLPPKVGWKGLELFVEKMLLQLPNPGTSARVEAQSTTI